MSSFSGGWRGWTGSWSQRRSTCEYIYITTKSRVNRIYSEFLYRAYDRYIEVQGERTSAQRLWVPGLEPAYQSYTTGHETIPEIPRRCAYKPWIGSEIYYKHGIEIIREGRFEGSWTDENKWDRLVWSAADTNHLPAKKRKHIVEPEECLTCRDVDNQTPSSLSGSGSGSVPVSGSSKTLPLAPDEASSPPTLTAKSDTGLTNMSGSQTSGGASSPDSSIVKSHPDAE
jgi:hypothetical protein